MENIILIFSYETRGWERKKGEDERRRRSILQKTEQIKTKLKYCTIILRDKMENEEGKEEYFLISLSALASHDKTLNANVSEMSESDYLSGALRDIKLFFFCSREQPVKAVHTASDGALSRVSPPLLLDFLFSLIVAKANKSSRI